MSSLVPLVASWSNGQQFANGKAKEDEIKQGKNYYSAVLYQGAQISSLSNIASKLANYIPNGPLQMAVKTGSAVAPVIGSGGCLFVAAVKQGHYDQSANALKGWVEKYEPRVNGLIPETLGQNTTHVCSHLADHMGKYMQGVMVTGTVALAIFEGPLIAGMMLTPVVYQAGESLGIVPTSIRAYTEKYFPTLTQVGLLIGGNPFSQVASGLMLASYIPSYNHFVHHWFDTTVHSLCKMNRPTLAEINAPLEMKKNLSFEEILAILEKDNYDYEDFILNPAHFSNWAIDPATLPKVYEFDRFLELIQKIDWTKRTRLLFLKFADDERFLGMISEQFPGKNDYSEHFDEYLTKILPEGMTKETFLADRFIDQFTFFIKVCKKEETPAGAQCHHLETIELAACILARLPELPPIEQEDILLKLGVEAGKYCGRGMRRACREIINGISFPGMAPTELYELRIRQSLEALRKNIIDHFCMKMLEMVKNGKNSTYRSLQTTDEATVAITQDIHTQDFAYNLFGLGFIPFSDIEKKAFGFSDLMNWEINSEAILADLYRIYYFQLHDVIRDVGETQLNQYIQETIGSNTQLTNAQKEELIDKISLLEWGFDTPQRIQRLMFFMLGILKLNPLREEPVIIKKEPAEEIDLSEWVEV